MECIDILYSMIQVYHVIELHIGNRVMWSTSNQVKISWSWPEYIWQLIFYTQGYLFISVLIGANNELMKLIIQHTKNDLNSSNPIHVSLALQCIANIGSPDMLEGVGHDVPKLLISGYVFCLKASAFVSNKDVKNFAFSYKKTLVLKSHF